MDKKGKYWYKITTYYCPICGKDDTFRTRVYEKDVPRPPEWNNRHEFRDMYDWCDS
jgi:hypothetical protein